MAKEKTMPVVVVYQNCLDCHHLDHSGSYTPGGAKLICGNSDACRTATAGKKLKKKDDRYHWKYRRVGDGRKIPDWCPLR